MIKVYCVRFSFLDFRDLGDVHHTARGGRSLFKTDPTKSQSPIYKNHLLHTNSDFAIVMLAILGHEVSRPDLFALVALVKLE